MSISIYSTDVQSLFNAISPTSNNQYFVREDVLIASTGASAIYADDVVSVDVTIEGTLLGAQSGLYLNGASNFNSVAVSATGNIIAYGTYALQLNGESNLVSNAGEITGHSLYGVTFGGANNSFVNTGTVTMQQPPSSVFGSAVYFSDADGARVINSGTLATSNPVATVKLFSAAGDAAYIENTGQILAVDKAIYDVGDGDTTVINRGHISGDIDLGGGHDVFDGRKGTVEGRIYGGAGNDIYIVDNADVEIVENTNEGSDTVMSSVSYELLYTIEHLKLTGSGDISGTGNWLNNGLNGNAGDNRLSGFWGNDNLNGQAGDDVLRGGKNNDTLNGGYGNDKLFGGLQNDDLSGGAGDDLLHGGAGKDVMDGGEGNDVFVFSKKSDSQTTNSDQIANFEKGVDVIDLSALVPGTFDLAINGPFSGSGPSVRTKIVKKHTQVLVDLDGDSSADMKIMVTNVKGLSELDFLL